MTTATQITTIVTTLDLDVSDAHLIAAMADLPVAMQNKLDAAGFYSTAMGWDEATIVIETEADYIALDMLKSFADANEIAYFEWYRELPVAVVAKMNVG